MSLHGTGSSASGSRLHSIETTCHGRVANAQRLLLAGLRRLLVERGAEGIDDG